MNLIVFSNANYTLIYENKISFVLRINFHEILLYEKAREQYRECDLALSWY